MTRGVIFDMDGVLVDNRDMHVEAFRIICEKYGVPFRGYDDFMNLFGMGNEEILAVLMPEVIKTIDWHKLADEKEATYREIFEKTIAPVKGLPDFLRVLKREGYKIAVGSSGSKENVDFVLGKCGIAEYFDVIVSGDMVTHCKPNPEIYLTTAGKLGLSPEECVVMEDAQAGIQAARRAGCPVVVLATTFPREQHSDYDVLIDDFTQITTDDIAKLTVNSVAVMNRAADNIRILAAAMVEKAKSGHPGGAMGGADFINVLYSEYLTYDPERPEWEGRDRFFLDPGHMAPMLYAQLVLTGKYSMEEIMQLRQWGSPTTGHPELNVARGIENTSGPLGQGHAYAVGAAIAAKFLAARTGNPTFSKETIYAYISDGGVQEEISQGAGRLAGHLGLDNLVMFYDANDIQLSTETVDVISENTAMKYRSWGWNVLEINGNDCRQIREALNAAKREDKRPTIIIGKCVMGKGARKADDSSYEANVKTHGAPLGEGAIENTIANLGGDPQNPFVVFDEVAQLYGRRREKLKAIVAQRHSEEEAWANSEPKKAEQLKVWLSGAAPQVSWDEVAVKSGDATRNASASALGVLAEQVPNMICASADLSNSDKTDGFLKKTHSFTRGDFSGAFFQAGVSELTMACCCIGMALHGGVVAACGTFFVFSDYMKPAIRMAALMELPVKFIWSHDSFRVGEDGPTHQPVEQEAQIRLMEKLKNHSGRNSMLVLRPADVKETIVCWKLAIENVGSPSALILTRQTVGDLPEGNDWFQATKGAYIVAGSDENPDVILLASGSEVPTLVAGAQLLRQDGIRCRVVSVPSEGLFRSQSKDYQESVLPYGVKKFGLTAGLPVNLEGLVGDDGKIWGLESFGFSAPYKVLDEKLGFTANNVYEQVKGIL